MRLVLDTNVLVSGMLTVDKPPGRIVDLLRAGKIQLQVDERIISEYEGVLSRPKFHRFFSVFEKDFTRRPSSAFATNSPWAEITFIHFNVPDKGLGFLDGHINYPLTQQTVNSLRSLVVDPVQNRCGKGWDIYAKTLQNLSKLDLRNV